MSLMTPDPANPERDGASVVHIDVNRAPFRQKTVIAYLTEVPEKGGLPATGRGCAPAASPERPQDPTSPPETMYFSELT